MKITSYIMLNHKGFTLIETLIAMLIISASMRLFITYHVQSDIVDKYQEQEKMGIYYAEHIQSMVLLDIAPFHQSIVDVTINLNGEIDTNGTIHVYVYEGYVLLTDQMTGHIIFEGEIE